MYQKDRCKLQTFHIVVTNKVTKGTRPTIAIANSSTTDSLSSVPIANVVSSETVSIIFASHIVAIQTCILKNAIRVTSEKINKGIPSPHSVGVMDEQFDIMQEF